MSATTLAAVVAQQLEHALGLLDSGSTSGRELLDELLLDVRRVAHHGTTDEWIERVQATPDEQALLELAQELVVAADAFGHRGPVATLLEQIFQGAHLLQLGALPPWLIMILGSVHVQFLRFRGSF